MKEADAQRKVDKQAQREAAECAVADKVLLRLRTLSSNAAPFFHLFLNILHKHNDIAKSPKYVHMKLKCRVIAKPEKKIKEPKKRKRNADEASPHMADDGKQFQQVMTPSGRIRKVHM